MTGRAGKPVMGLREGKPISIFPGNPDIIRFLEVVERKKSYLVWREKIETRVRNTQYGMEAH